jgi:hypothetical protein
MASSEMLRRVALVRIDVSEERSASIIKVTRVGEPILVTLVMEALSSSETPVLTRATRRNIPEDVTLQAKVVHHLWSQKRNVSEAAIFHFLLIHQIWHFSTSLSLQLYCRFIISGTKIMEPTALLASSVQTTTTIVLMAGMKNYPDGGMPLSFRLHSVDGT